MRILENVIDGRQGFGILEEIAREPLIDEPDGEGEKLLEEHRPYEDGKRPKRAGKNGNAASTN